MDLIRERGPTQSIVLAPGRVCGQVGTRKIKHTLIPDGKATRLETCSTILRLWILPTQLGRARSWSLERLRPRYPSPPFTSSAFVLSPKPPTTSPPKKHCTFTPTRLSLDATPVRKSLYLLFQYQEKTGLKNHFVGWKHRTNTSRYSSVRCKHPPLSHPSPLLWPFHPSTPLGIVLPFKQRKRDSPTSISCILSLQPQLVVGSVQELQLPSPSLPSPAPVSCPNPPSTGFWLLPFCLRLPGIVLALYVSRPPPHQPEVFCLFKNPVLLTQLPPPLSVSRASISSDLYSINTSIGHSPADSPIHLARQLDLFPLTALVFVRLLVLTFSLHWHSQVLFSKTTNLVSFSHPRYALKVRLNPLNFHHRIGALSSSVGVGARGLQPVHEVDRSPTNLRSTSTFDL